MAKHRAVFRTIVVGLCVVLMTINTSLARAFQAEGTTRPSEKIAQLTAKIRESEQGGIDALPLGRMWGHLAEEYEDAGQYDKAESAYNQALHMFGQSPNMAKDYAVALENLGGLNLVLNNDDAAVKCRTRALAVVETTGDKVDTARAKGLLAEAYFANRKYKNARQLGAEAYSEMILLRDSDERIVGILVLLAFASSLDGHHTYALERARDAESLALATLPADSQPIGEARMALGYAEWKAGVVDGPAEEMREGIRILNKWTTAGHTYMVWALTQYLTYLKATHQTKEARQVAEQVKAEMGRMSGGCINCTVSVYGLLAR